MKNAIRVATAVAVLVTSVPVNAEMYYFRYKTDVTFEDSTGGGIGNDITVDFSGAIGYAFSKVIPVSTKDVVQWVKVSGSYQQGLALDPKTGVISGTATGKPKTNNALLIGLDSEGKRIAQANITFRFTDPVGKPSQFLAYGHAGQYLYRTIPSTVAVSRWESLTILPDDLRTQGTALAGNPTAKYEQEVAFRGFDYLGREIAFASGDLLVEDGPQIAHIEDRITRPGLLIQLAPKIAHKVGTVRYALTAIDGLPKGLSFDVSNGELKGSISTFSTTLRFQIKATDQDGTSGTSNIFSLSTVDPDASIASVGTMHGVVGKPFGKKLTAYELTGDQSWEVVGGTLPEGLSLDEDTGTISGTPVKEETQQLNIAVSTSLGGYDETGTFTFKVAAQTVGVTFAQKNARVGENFVTAGATVEANATAPWSFELAQGADLAEGLAVDTATAKVSGAVVAPGDASVAFRFTNGDGNSKTVMQPITVYNALGLSYADTPKFQRRLNGSTAPLVAEGSVIGVGRFSVTEGALPPGLKLDRDTGAISGQPLQVGTWPGIVVTIQDSSGTRAGSNKFSIKVDDRPQVEAVIAAASVERYVDNGVLLATANNALDGVKFELSAGALPEGLKLEEDGYLTGRTSVPVGTYGGLKVRATDGDGSTSESDEFSIEIVAPAALDDLTDEAANMRWTQNVPFSFTLPRPSNAFGTTSYKVEGLPDGVFASGDRLSGVLPDVGIYALTATITDDAGRALEAPITLEILPPMTVEFPAPPQAIALARFSLFAAKAASTPTFSLPRGVFARVAPVVENGIEPVTYSYNGAPPTGMAYVEEAIQGIPEVSGEAVATTATIRDAAGTQIVIPLSLKIAERLAIEIGYDVASPAGLVGDDFAISPTVKNAIGPQTFELNGDLPEGLSFDEETGRILGKAKEDGRFGPFTVTATDSEGADYAGTSDPFEIGVALPGKVGLANTTTYTVRAEQSFLKKLAVSNVTPPLSFTTNTGMPQGAALNGVDGTISGVFAQKGNYSGHAAVTDTFGRSKDTLVKFIAIGALEVSPPTALTIAQYGAMSSHPTAANTVGLARFEIAAGTLPDGLSLNAKTGRIEGSAQKKGSWPGIVVRVTDATGESAVSTAFTLTVGDRLPLQINTAASNSVFVNLNYKMTVPVLNAQGAVTFVRGGNLPPGIVFDAKKRLYSGIATSLGSYTATLTATDEKGGTVTKSITFVVTLNDKPISLTLTDYVTKVGRQIVTAAPKWSNNVGDTEFSADAILAQHGLSIDPTTGIVTGSATELMDITANVHVTDPTDRITSKPLNIKVIPDTVVNAPERIDLIVNTAMSPVNATASNTVGTAKWQIEGSLPAGVTFNTSTARFSGTPTQMGTFPVVITNTDSIDDAQSAKVTIVVANNGAPPTIAVNLATTGYTVTIAQSITPTYTNRKTGDVVTLAPNSGPLPPGMTLVQNSAGTYILSKTVLTNAEIGVYRGIVLRITDVEGLYMDTPPLDIVYRPVSFLAYPAMTISTRAKAPVKTDAPVASAGLPIKDVTFEFSSKAAGGQNLSIDPKTGEISGFVTAAGTNVVKVTESYDGNTIRTFNYNVSLRVLDIAVVFDDIAVFKDVPYVSDTVDLNNGLPGGTFTVVGEMPEGITFDPTTMKFVGTSSATGSYPISLNYQDDYGSFEKALSIHVAEGGTGHRYWRVGYRKAYPAGSASFYDFDLLDANGGNLNALAKITGNPVLFDNDPTTSVNMGNDNSTTTWRYVEFEFPQAVDAKTGVADVVTSIGANVLYDWSDDGVTWTRAGSVSWTQNAPRATKKTAF